MKKLILTLALLTAAACTDEEASMRALNGAGYTSISLTGYSHFGCGRDDTFRTGFVAKGPTGVMVSGVVCCGMWAKGCTIRMD